MAHQTDIAIFWAYDRQAMGPPPVLFDRNLQDVAMTMGNAEPENARLFAMASVAMADAATAAWDAKFEDNYWRPHHGDSRRRHRRQRRHSGRPRLEAARVWGNDVNDWSDDFTPPFPAWPSGHATMGGALFEVLRDFSRTDNVNYVLNSAESMPSGSQHKVVHVVHSGGVGERHEPYLHGCPLALRCGGRHQTGERHCRLGEGERVPGDTGAYCCRVADNRTGCDNFVVPTSALAAKGAKNAKNEDGEAAGATWLGRRTFSFIFLRPLCLFAATSHNSRLAPAAVQWRAFIVRDCRRLPLSALLFVHLHCHSHYSLLDARVPSKGSSIAPKNWG